MSDKDEATRLADALEKLCVEAGLPPDGNTRKVVNLLRRWPDGEPVMVYHGRCTIDCGEHGHHDVELLKLIPQGTKLYTAPPDQSERIAALEAALPLRLGRQCHDRPRSTAHRVMAKDIE